MADKKISALTAATIPLVGSEVLPIVQGGSTVKVSVDNLTAGKAVSALNLVVTGSTIPANGVYLPSANSLGLATNSAVRLYINSSGSVGIGTDTPGQRLDVVSAANSATAYTALFRTTGVAGYSGLIGMGVNPTAAGAYTAAAFGAENVNGTANDGGILKILTATANSSHTLTERMRIDNNGNVTVSNGNIIVGTAAKGIDFSANTGQPGMTSELLNWYETGTWTPADASGAGLTISVTAGTTPKYTRIGNIVFFTADISYPSTADTNNARLSLPVPTSATNPLGTGVIGFRSDSIFSVIAVYSTGTSIIGPLNTFQTNANLSGVRIFYSATYFAA